MTVGAVPGHDFDLTLLSPESKNIQNKILNFEDSPIFTKIALSDSLLPLCEQQIHMFN